MATSRKENTWIDPFAFIKGAQEGEKLRQSAQRANEDMFNLQRRREVDDYNFAKQQELDQYKVPLERVTSELGLAQNQDKMEDLQVKQAIQSIASTGFQDEQGNRIAFDQNDPRSIDYMKQVVAQMQSSNDPIQQRTAATILNRELPQLALRQVQMNIDDPVRAAQFAKQAGIRNIGDVVMNKDGTYSFYGTDLAGNRQILGGRALTQPEASAYIGSLVSKSPLTAYGAQQAVAGADAKLQAAMEKIRTAQTQQEANSALAEARLAKAQLDLARSQTTTVDPSAAALGLGPAGAPAQDKFAALAAIADKIPKTQQAPAKLTDQQLTAQSQFVQNQIARSKIYQNASDAEKNALKASWAQQYADAMGKK